MQELLVLGQAHNGALPKMISSKPDASNTLFSFMFESNPLDKVNFSYLIEQSNI